ncbi:MAG: hypothetical protein A2231_09340 [Candidatus Firestonebacteria bacterium RIFOXYA2_FULL_40_8]|nr:MAG: hypothetical protein A2231_09340 [Candidatus Firestonebacteria bacterium RIFOXYA2_FULL_40_8]
MTPPYGVVNCWQQLPGFPYRGGMVFLTGSIAYGLRMVYDWMFGIKPRLNGLVIDPCIPKTFKKLESEFKWLDGRVHLTIRNPNKSECNVKTMTVDGKQVSSTTIDPFSRRKLFAAPDALLKTKGTHEIVVTL